MRKGLSKRAQSTAEYAIVLALVVGAVVAMQVYVKRGLQGRIKNAVEFVGVNGNVGGSDFGFSTNQYEPYYVSSDQGSSSAQLQNEVLGTEGAVGRASTQASIVRRNQTVGWSAKDAAAAVSNPTSDEAVTERQALPATPKAPQEKF
jgi:hypothetical protein